MKIVDKNQKQKYEYSILSNSEDTFLIIDLQGEVVYASEMCERFFGYTPELLQGMQLYELFDASYLDGKQSFFKGTECKKLGNCDAKIKTKNGRLLGVHIITIPIFSKSEHEYNGSYIVLKEKVKQISSTDYSEKDSKKMIKKLTHLSEKYAVAGQLVAGIAHEIRNPITAIKGFLQLLNREDTENKVYFEIIDSEIERIEVILRELMILAKPNQMAYEKVNIKQLLDQVMILMEPQSLLNNIQMVKKNNFTNLWVMGDENQLKQVFINYIKNAIEAMPEGGHLKINGNVNDKNIVTIQIQDEGCGIPETNLEKIGEPFFTTKENGTGLGMLVSQQIIEEHKGSIEIMSNKEGTIITVKLPLVLFEI